jgi:hypothetical protein
MAKGPVAIQVEGGKELRKSLKTMSSDNGWRAPLRDSYRAAASVGESEGRSLASQSRPTLGGTSATMGGAAIGSIKGKGTTTGATLQGGSGIAYFAGWNFGSAGAHRQFPAKARPDYNMYKAIENKRDEIVETFGNEIDAALNKEF